jgi:hypothetical protein
MNKKAVSKQTLKNWWIDAGLFSGAVLAALSGNYFLYLPNGGYQGGRNPMANVVILFDRHTWDDLHTWSGVAMIAIAAIHLAVHWPWVNNMLRRSLKELTGQCGCMNLRGRFNLWLNAVVALSFLLTAISGIYFLFVPGGRLAADPQIFFSRTTWDLIHTWAGVTLIAAAMIHFAIHWKWVVKVTRSLFVLLPNAPMAPLPARLDTISKV